MDIDEQEHRLAAVFGKTKVKDIPWLTTETLFVYHEYLMKQLTFPIIVRFNELDVKISGLSSDIDEMYGIITEGRIGRKKFSPALSEVTADKTTKNGLIIDGYLTWFWNNR